MTNHSLYQQILTLLDLTRLQDNDSPTAMQQWLEQMATADYVPAAFCVYPAFVQQTKQHLVRHGIRANIATVVNFPSGQQPLEQVLADIQYCIAQGVDEIDCVLPYSLLLQGQYQAVQSFLTSVRLACGRVCLKVIIESGELATPQQIIKATELCVAADVDFVKTSTGKVPVGCTLEAARSILTALAASGKSIGFKASGGVRSVAQAQELVALYETIIGKAAHKDAMRIGASALLDELKPLLAAG